MPGPFPQSQQYKSEVSKTPKQCFHSHKCPPTLTAIRNKHLQITHPKRIHSRQLFRINSTTNKIHHRLISRQIRSSRQSSQTTRALHHELTILCHTISQHIRSETVNLVLASKPMTHLVAHEDGELHFELRVALGLDKGARNGHDSGGEDSFHVEGAHEGLEIGGQAEGNRLRIMEDGLTERHARDEFGAPNSARGAGDGEFLGEARVHVHDVGHERQGGELVGEGAAEEPEVGELGEGGAEVVLEDGRWDIFLLNCAEGLEADAVSMIDVLLQSVVSFCS